MHVYVYGKISQILGKLGIRQGKYLPSLFFTGRLNFKEGKSLAQGKYKLCSSQSW